MRDKLFKLVHTARYLCFKQIYFRLYYRFHKLSIKPWKYAGSCLRDWNKAWFSPNLFLSTLTTHNQITFLGKSGTIKAASDWNNPSYSKLWLYNLHYFNELNTIDADSHTDMFNRWIEKWISDNPPFVGNGWEPYPLSIRIVNLIKWYSRHRDKIKPYWIESLGNQAEALLCQLEYHILGNHLFANAKALIFAGTYFKDERAEKWLKKGLKILDKEINEQFLPDGGHFELSPMYHASLLWDLCDLLNLANQSGLAELITRGKKWQALIEGALLWLTNMSHPDGQISFFNDAAFNISPTLSEIKNYLSHLEVNIPAEMNAPLSLNWLKDSGYCVINLDNNSKAILDMAKIGPNYQPGHAHADTLSFELSLFSQRFIVNSGTSDYDSGILRQQQRSTSAHNTVCIDGANSSEVWAGFRVARRAFPKNISINSPDTEQLRIHCSHDGFLRLPGRNRHHRTWNFSKNKLTIHDRIEGKFNMAEAYFYFHPDIIIEEKNDLECHLPCNKKVFIKIHGANDILLQSSLWYPSFGTALQNKRLIIRFDCKDLLIHIEW